MKLNLKKKQKQILYLAGSFLGVILVIYLLFSVYFRNHFFYGTVINGKDCTGMTVNQVVELFGLEKDQAENVTVAKEMQPTFLWFTGFFEKNELTVKPLTSSKNEVLWDVLQRESEEDKASENKNTQDTPIETTDSSKLKQRKIIYPFGERQEVLNYAIFENWLTEQADGTIQISEVKVREYVEKLCAVYSTKNTYRNFWGSDGEFHRVSPGDYGWEIDKEAEVKFLMEHLLEEGEAVRQVVYLQEAASREKQEWGNTYIEINMNKQHLWAYKDGDLLVDTPIVTGNASRGWDTPEGIYAVYGKAKNRILRGATYRSFVNYWMPINGNIGIHDATWRSEFGGAIYETNGSHGCINVPKAAMDVIYPNMAVGTPVILYD